MKRIILVLILVSAPLFAQELDATVVINNEQLTSKYKDLLSEFPRTVETYLNTTRFTDSQWEGAKIKCSFNIFFTGATNENKFSAQVVVTSQRDVYNSDTKSLMLSLMDDSWQFQYEQGQSVRYNPLDFDPLASFLDFYAYLIIGYDADSYQEYSGTDMYQKAYNLVILGNNSSFKNGWELDRSSYNKRGLLEELTGEKYLQFRADFFNYHYNGLDLLKDDYATGIANIKALVINLAKNQAKYARSVLLKVFFDAKNGEMIELFRNNPDKSIFTYLKKVDPAHISKYNEVSND